MPPRIEAQIWQLPVTTLNLAKADMYMFMLEQEFPGPGKRGLRAANAERELAVASAEFETQRLGMAGEIRRAYVTLALARRDLLAAFDTGRALEQLVELAQTTYATGSGSQVSVVRALLEVSRLQERIALLAGEERMGVARLNTLLGRRPDGGDWIARGAAGGYDHGRSEQFGRRGRRPPPSRACRAGSREPDAVGLHPRETGTQARLDGAGRLHAHPRRGGRVDGARGDHLAHGPLVTATVGRLHCGSRPSPRGCNRRGCSRRVACSRDGGGSGGTRRRCVGSPRRAAERTRATGRAPGRSDASGVRQRARQHG